MAGVITESCIKCKNMDCVEVCPVDAFYEGENMLVINPSECVDCGCCIEECPIDAIVFDNEERAIPWLELNAKYSKIWPNVTSKGSQKPHDSDEFSGISGKYEHYFSSNPGRGDVDTRSSRVGVKQCGHCQPESKLTKLWKLIATWFR